MENRLLYRPSEAAQSLGVSRSKVYELLQTGELRSVRIGGSRRIPAEDLEAFVRRLRATCGCAAIEREAVNVGA